MRDIQFLEIQISMDFDDDHIPENCPINPLSLKARAFIREATDMIWTFGTATRFTKLEIGGCAAGGFRMEATKAWKARSRLLRGSSSGGSSGREAMKAVNWSNYKVEGLPARIVHEQASALARYLRRTHELPASRVSIARLCWRSDFGYFKLHSLIALMFAWAPSSWRWVFFIHYY